MGLRRTAQALGAMEPDLARRLIQAAACQSAPADKPFEYVYLFRGEGLRDSQFVYKLGRSRRPEKRIKAVRRHAYFADWEVIHQIHCFDTTGRISPSEGDTLESLFHGLFTRYQVARAFGVEYFALPESEIVFVCGIHFVDAISLNIGVLDRDPSRMHERW